MDRNIIIEATERLYAINREISAAFIARQRRPSVNQITHVNWAIGEVIKQLREQTKD